MFLSKSVCYDKVVKCRHIYASTMSSAFVASLSQQCGLTFFYDDCHDKLFIIVTNFLFLLLCLCHEKAMKCRDKVQLTLSHNYHDKLYYVMTFFLASSFFPLFCRDNHFYVATFSSVYS